MDGIYVHRGAPSFTSIADQRWQLSHLFVGNLAYRLVQFVDLAFSLFEPAIADPEHDDLLSVECTICRRDPVFSQARSDFPFSVAAKDNATWRSTSTDR